tara:strand:- start:670 stop:957 length:288 start_codon:yes stop_codon:yes gene_type:complete
MEKIKEVNQEFEEFWQKEKGILEVVCGIDWKTAKLVATGFNSFLLKKSISKTELEIKALEEKLSNVSVSILPSEVAPFPNGQIARVCGEETQIKS